MLYVVCNVLCVLNGLRVVSVMCKLCVARFVCMLRCVVLCVVFAVGVVWCWCVMCRMYCVLCCVRVACGASCVVRCA